MRIEPTPTPLHIDDSGLMETLVKLLKDGTEWALVASLWNGELPFMKQKSMLFQLSARTTTLLSLGYTQPVLSQCHSPIDENINADLEANPMMEEVRAVVFQLGVLKAPGSDGFNGLFLSKFVGNIKD